MSQVYSEFDVIVIGGGPAGLSAALLLVRARRSVLVIDSGEPRNAPAEHMHGYLTRDSMPPEGFLELCREEVASYGAELVSDTVVAMSPDRAVKTASGRSYKARRVIVATGVRDILPGLPGFEDRWGRDLLHCPYCHGYEVADRDFAVIATHPGSLDHALLLRQWTNKISLIANGQQIGEQDRQALEARGVVVIDSVATGLHISDDSVVGVEMGDTTHPCDVVFVAPQMRPRDAFVDVLGCQRDEFGFLQVDRTWRTSVSWVYAAGNNADAKAQVIGAAGQGSSAAFNLNLDLTQEDTARAVAAAAKNG